MDQSQALIAFAAMSQETRLGIVRLLVRAGHDGLPAGEIAERMKVSPSNMSFHLKELERAGLIGSRREARSIIYAADYPGLAALVRFLLEDCCSGRAEVCGPVLSAPRCAPAPSRRSRRKEKADA
jgi:DNA-binding transcriptional ArsR family regulator